MTLPSWIWHDDVDLDLGFCESLIKEFDQRRPIDAQSEGVDYINISTDQDFAIQDQKIFTEINSALARYLEQLNQGEHRFSPLRPNTGLTDIGYWIQRLRKKIAHDWQEDSDIGGQTDVTKVLSCMVFLNDMRYGGEIEFIDGTKITPKQGQILIYPATWNTLYRTLASKDKDRYVILTGFYLTANKSSETDQDAQTPA